MSIDFQKFSAVNQNTVDSLVNVANAALSAAERIVALNLDTTRTAIGDSASAARTILGASDPQSAIAAQQALVQPAVEKATTYTKALYEISTDVQQQLSKLYEAQVADFQKAAADAMSQMTKGAPAGSDAMVKAMQDAFQKATSAFGTASAMTKQFTSAAEAAVAAVTPKGKAK